MTWRQFFYNPSLNFILRSAIRFLFIDNPPNFLKIPVNGTLTYKLPNSEKIVLNTNETCYVTRLIYWNGLMGYEYTKIFIELINSCEVFLDIGSQLGYYSIIAKKINDKVEVHAFEPSPGPLYYLKKNIEQNGLVNKIKMHELALSDSTGLVHFYENYHSKYPYVKFPLKGGNNTSHPYISSYNEYKVKSITLDDFVLKNNIKKISLIKIDTEGTEYSILENGKNSIETFRPIVICEMLIEHIEQSQRILDLFNNYDYLFYYNSGDELISFTNKEFDTVINRDRTDYFIVPREKSGLLTCKKTT